MGQRIQTRAILLFLLRALSLLLTAPYRRTFRLYTWKPLGDIRATEGDHKLQLQLMRNWKADKYDELQSVQVAASFCAGAALATIPLTRDRPVPRSASAWVADALWFSSLICSIWAVITSIQTKSILDDLPDADQLDASLPELEVQRMRRVILRYRKTPGLNHCIMLFIWQFPSMTMSYAWCTFIGGLTVYLLTPFTRSGSWDGDHNVAVIYLTVGGLGLLTYVFSSIFVYAGEKDFDRSMANVNIDADSLESGFAIGGARMPPQRPTRSKRQLLI